MYFTCFTDGEAPIIMCPADIYVSTRQSSWDDPTVSDNFDTELDVSCSPPSGSTFTSGETETVTCTAVDDAMNSAQCMFDVTVGMDVDLWSYKSTDMHQYYNQLPEDMFFYFVYEYIIGLRDTSLLSFILSFIHEIYNFTLLRHFALSPTSTFST